MKLTAQATRSGSWWAVNVPEIDGLYTQAKRLDQIPAMVADAASLLTGLPETEFEIVVTVGNLFATEISDYTTRAHDANKAVEKMAATSRKVVTTMRKDGLSVRDIATLLHLSPQRVSQLAKTA